MKLSTYLFAAVSSLLILSASATTLTTGINMDNGYIAYISTSDSVQGTQFGAANYWYTTFIDSVTLAPGTDYYLHIYGYDQGGAAGFLGEFNLDSPDHVFSNSSSNLLTNTTDWKANNTGFNDPYASVTGYGTNGVSPWGTRSGVSSTAQWIWSGDNNNNNAAYFTTKISATSSSVPDGGTTVLMLGLSLLGMAGIKGKLRK